MQSFKSFGPMEAELQAPPCPRTRTLLPPFILNLILLFYGYIEILSICNIDVKYTGTLHKKYLYFQEASFWSFI